MKLALHRSIAFWAGLLVMAFVCWAWHHSYFFNYYATHRGYGVSHMNGGIALAKTQFLRTLHGSNAASTTIFRVETFPPPLFIRSADAPRSAEPPAIYPPFTIKESWTAAAKHESGSVRIFIPHWLILLAVALLWFALLFWRARRRSAAVKVSS